MANQDIQQTETKPEETPGPPNCSLGVTLQCLLIIFSSLNINSA